MNQVNYNDLKTLWYCVRFQSFSAAARAMNKTESTVSTAMKRLAMQGGYQLFVQVGHGERPMKPTGHAIRLARMIDPIVREIERPSGLWSATTYPESRQKGLSVDPVRDKGQFSLSVTSPSEGFSRRARNISKDFTKIACASDSGG